MFTVPEFTPTLIVPSFPFTVTVPLLPFVPTEIVSEFPTTETVPLFVVTPIVSELPATETVPSLVPIPTVSELPVTVVVPLLSSIRIVLCQTPRAAQLSVKPFFQKSPIYLTFALFLTHATAHPTPDRRQRDLLPALLPGWERRSDLRNRFNSVNKAAARQPSVLVPASTTFGALSAFAESTLHGAGHRTPFPGWETRAGYFREPRAFAPALATNPPPTPASVPHPVHTTAPWLFTTGRLRWAEKPSLAPRSGRRCELW